MIIGGLDIETTGLEQEEGHRIIEISMRRYDLVKRELVDEYTARIHPVRSISAKAEAVHHISLVDLAGCPTWDVIGPKVASFMALAPIWVAHNGDEFDFPFVANELIRIGQPIPEIKTFDTMQQGRWATPLGKLPTLGELCFALDVPYDPSLAHGAGYDVSCMMACLFKGMDLGFYKPDLPFAAKEAA